MEKTRVRKLDGTYEENLIALKEMLGLRPDQDLSEFEFNEKDDENK